MAVVALCYALGSDVQFWTYRGQKGTIDIIFKWYETSRLQQDGFYSGGDRYECFNRFKCNPWFWSATNFR